MQSEIDRTAQTTRFNGNSILTQSTAFEFQIGSNATTNDMISVSAINIMNTTPTTGSDTGAVARSASSVLDISTVGSRGTAASAANYNAYTAGMGTGALGAIEAIDYALQQVNVARSTFGAAQNRFDAVISNLNVAMENQAAARSRIVDADYAAETARLARAQVLQQAGTAMLSQANQLPQQVLQLLRG